MLYVLELFERRRRPLPARDVATALDMPRSSTNGLLTSLVNLGYLRFEPEEQTYFPTMGVHRLGAWLVDSVEEDRRIEAFMHDLSLTTGETIALTVQERFDVRFVRVLRSRFPIALQLAENDRISVFDSASGGALLSLADDDEVRALVDAFNQEQANDSEALIDEATLLTRVRKIRRTGISTAYAAYLPETGGIAIALKARVDGLAASVGIGGPAARIRSSEKPLTQALATLRAKHDV